MVDDFFPAEMLLFYMKCFSSNAETIAGIIEPSKSCISNICNTHPNAHSMVQNTKTVGNKSRISEWLRL